MTGSWWEAVPHGWEFVESARQLKIGNSCRGLISPHKYLELYLCLRWWVVENIEIWGQWIFGLLKELKDLVGKWTWGQRSGRAGLRDLFLFLIFHETSSLNMCVNGSDWYVEILAFCMLVQVKMLKLYQCSQPCNSSFI